MAIGHSSMAKRELILYRGNVPENMQVWDEFLTFNFSQTCLQNWNSYADIKSLLSSETEVAFWHDNEMG